MTVSWWPFVIIVAGVAPIVWGTLRPWSTCSCCDGEATHRDPRTRRFTGHCTACSGWGTQERPVRRTVRALTGERVFRHPPERPIDGQVFNQQIPFVGGGRRPRRPRTGYSSGRSERRDPRRRSTG